MNNYTTNINTIKDYDNSIYYKIVIFLSILSILFSSDHASAQSDTDKFLQDFFNGKVSSTQFQQRYPDIPDWQIKRLYQTKQSGIEGVSGENYLKLFKMIDSCRYAPVVISGFIKNTGGSVYSGEGIFSFICGDLSKSQTFSLPLSGHLLQVAQALYNDKSSAFFHVGSPLADTITANVVIPMFTLDGEQIKDYSTTDQNGRQLPTNIFIEQSFGDSADVVKRIASILQKEEGAVCSLFNTSTGYSVVIETDKMRITVCPINGEPGAEDSVADYATELNDIDKDLANTVASAWSAYDQDSTALQGKTSYVEVLSISGRIRPLFFIEIKEDTPSIDILPVVCLIGVGFAGLAPIVISRTNTMWGRFIRKSLHWEKVDDIASQTSVEDNLKGITSDLAFLEATPEALDRLNNLEDLFALMDRLSGYGRFLLAPELEYEIDLFYAHYQEYLKNGGTEVVGYNDLRAYSIHLREFKKRLEQHSGLDEQGFFFRTLIEGYFEKRPEDIDEFLQKCPSLSNVLVRYKVRTPLARAEAESQIVSFNATLDGKPVQANTVKELVNNITSSLKTSDPTASERIKSSSKEILGLITACLEDQGNFQKIQSHLSERSELLSDSHGGDIAVIAYNVLDARKNSVKTIYITRDFEDNSLDIVIGDPVEVPLSAVEIEKAVSENVEQRISQEAEVDFEQLISELVGLINDSKTWADLNAKREQLAQLVSNSSIKKVLKYKLAEKIRDNQLGILIEDKHRGAIMKQYPHRAAAEIIDYLAKDPNIIVNDDQYEAFTEMAKTMLQRQDQLDGYGLDRSASGKTYVSESERLRAHFGFARSEGQYKLRVCITGDWH